MDVLILNSPWPLSDVEYGVKSGTRWAARRQRNSSMPYFPYPYVMAMTARFLRERGVEARVKDAIAENLSHDGCLDFVATAAPRLLVIETFTPSSHADLAFARHARARTGCRIAFCGAHATAVPEEIMKEEAIDFVLMGEYARPLLSLALALQDKRAPLSAIPGLAFRDSGRVVFGQGQADPLGPDELPHPDFDELPPARYNEPLSTRFPNAKVVTSFGCPYVCSFCTVPVVNGHHRHRQRSIARVLDEIRLLVGAYGVREIYFDDDLFTLPRARAVAESLIAAGMQIPWSCWIDWQVTATDMALLRKSGCVALKVGVESSTPGILDDVGKVRGFTPQRLEAFADACRSFGILSHGSFCLGLPGDTPKSMSDTVDLAFSAGLDSTQFSIATPLPGTRFYADARRAGWLVSDDWSLFEGLHSCVVEYPSCTREEILAAMRDAERRKVRHFVTRPALALRYLWKLYQFEGTKGFLKDLRGKAGFAAKAIRSEPRADRHRARA